ncbi:hypothetical protein [Rhodococcus erythropolis]|nr:hypothetical protein [Rhodococcus erythropolis]
MAMYIRRETSSDRDAVYSLLGAAFADQTPPGETPSAAASVRL